MNSETAQARRYYHHVLHNGNLTKHDVARMVEYIERRDVRIEQLEAAIKRQAGAAQTLRNLTLDEVRHLQDKDRSEYNAAKTLDSEREANEILTDRVEQLEAALATARNDALREAAEAAGSLLPENGAGEAQDATDRLIDVVRRECVRDITALITEEPS